MKFKDISQLSAQELNSKVRELNESLLHLRVKKQTGQIKNTHELRSLRKDIARVLTALAQKRTH